MFKRFFATNQERNLLKSDIDTSTLPKQVLNSMTGILQMKQTLKLTLKVQGNKKVKKAKQEKTSSFSNLITHLTKLFDAS